MNPQAGWYPDPYDPNRLRYWDGVAWTEATSPGAADAASASPPSPPFGPEAWGASWGTPAPGANPGYGDVGRWINTTFEHIFKRIAPLSILLVAVPIPGSILFAVALWTLVRRLSIEDVGGDLRFEGLDTGLATLTVVGLLVAVVSAAVSWLAATHQLYAAHLRQPQTAGRSLLVGLRRLPRAIGWTLLGFVVYAGTFLAVGLAFAGVVAILPTPGPLGGLLLVVGAIALVGVIILVMIRMSLVGVAMAIGPGGTNPYWESWRVTRDRWWATLGRFLLLGLIAAAASFIINVMSQILVGPSAANVIVGPDGEVLVNGQTVDGGLVVLSEYLPGTGWFILAVLISLVGSAIQQAVYIAGSVGLYVAGGGAGEV